mmetsp:Transcript_3987/g.9600  ORF Transcript_3987/g.9600 Transcript_3987/m.9600 type:complete len:282 (-) Transcript_3987:956-1801(-)
MPMVVMSSPKYTSSAARPAISTCTRSSSRARVGNRYSSSRLRLYVVMVGSRPRGTMLTRSTSSISPVCLYITDATSAWPSSCRVRRRTTGVSLSAMGYRSPLVTRSQPFTRSSVDTTSPPRRMQMDAASLHTLASSAPDSPGRFFANCMVSMSGSTLRLARWICRILARASKLGSGTRTLRSKRPGRISAGSSRSARLVAPMNTTPVSGVKPSISVSSWLSVCSCSSVPRVPAAPRLAPSASISSTNTRHGALRRARLNRSRMRAAPTPTMISTNSDPLML